MSRRAVPGTRGAMRAEPLLLPPMDRMSLKPPVPQAETGVINPAEAVLRALAAVVTKAVIVDRAEWATDIVTAFANWVALAVDVYGAPAVLAASGAVVAVSGYMLVQQAYKDGLDDAMREKIDQAIDWYMNNNPERFIAAVRRVPQLAAMIKPPQTESYEFHLKCVIANRKACEYFPVRWVHDPLIRLAASNGAPSDFDRATSDVAKFREAVRTLANQGTVVQVYDRAGLQAVLAAAPNGILNAYESLARALPSAGPAPRRAFAAGRRRIEFLLKARAMFAPYVTDDERTNPSFPNNMQLDWRRFRTVDLLRDERALVLQLAAFDGNTLESAELKWQRQVTMRLTAAESSETVALYVMRDLAYSYSEDAAKGTKAWIKRSIKKMQNTVFGRRLLQGQPVAEIIAEGASAPLQAFIAESALRIAQMYPPEEPDLSVWQRRVRTQLVSEANYVHGAVYDPELPLGRALKREFEEDMLGEDALLESTKRQQTDNNERAVAFEEAEGRNRRFGGVGKDDTSTASAAVEAALRGEHMLWVLDEED